jgi:hypothetical protein
MSESCEALQQADFIPSKQVSQQARGQRQSALSRALLNILHYPNKRYILGA